MPCLVGQGGHQGSGRGKRHASTIRCIEPHAARMWLHAIQPPQHAMPTSRAHPRPLLPSKQGAPKLKVAIVGGGLAGLSTAVELLDQG